MDWKSLISDLRQRGANQSEIADLCGCTQSTISVLSAGKATQPSFRVGQALMRLHGTGKREFARCLTALRDADEQRAQQRNRVHLNSGG